MGTGRGIFDRRLWCQCAFSHIAMSALYQVFGGLCPDVSGISLLISA